MTGTARPPTGEEGFTLVELLVVVIIIGILGSIAIPAYLGQREQARVTQMEADLRNAATRMEQGLRTNGGAYTADALIGFRPTSGVTTVATHVAATEFCLTASRPGLADRTWHSSAGGLQPDGVAC